MAERSLPELAREITSGAVRIAAATAAWLRLIAEFDRRGGWQGIGIASCAHCLAWQCGMSPGTAREHVRVARALTGLPLLAAAFAEGRLSCSKVRALTRIAEPGTEQALLELAIEATASQTERLVRSWRRAEPADPGTVALKRQFQHWWDDDGMLVIRMRMDAEEGAQFLTAVESIAEREVRRDRAAARRVAADPQAPTGPDELERDEVACARERTAARRCAAVARLAGAAHHLDRRPGDPPRREVVVHVDADVLADDTAAGQAYLDGGPALHPAQVRRMLARRPSSRCWSAAVRCSASGAGAGAPPRPSVAPCSGGTVAAPVPAAPRPGSSGCTRTTCGTGCWAAAPTWTTWCSCATSTTDWCTSWTW
ncbi:DUF222 domain-containing protein [Blastococcus montanus]|uniref:DUF222 domain-containing protein n=1 Tax=Blastococcus montanus TaxID=3144973 RepID=UPI00320B21FF